MLGTIILYGVGGWAFICLAVWFLFLRNVPFTDDNSTYGAPEGEFRGYRD